MITFTLDDINDTPLRAAVELGIANAVSLKKDELILAVRNHLSPNTPLVLAPSYVNPPESLRNNIWRSPAVFVSILALVVSIVRGYPKSFPLKVEGFGRVVVAEVTISAGFRESSTRD